MALEHVRHKEGSGAEVLLACSPPLAMDRVVTGIVRGTLEKSSKVVIDLDVGRKVTIRKILIIQTTTLQ